MERRTDEALIWSPPFDIALDWLDANGHLNMAYYHVMFDRTVDIALEALAFGVEYRKAQNASIFNVETHVLYRQEVRGDDRVRVSVQLLGRDDKRLHIFQTMWRLADNELVASSESLFLHVDLGTRRVTPMTAAVCAALDAMIERHAAAGLPDNAGRRIAALASAPVR
ncbi:thioesterase family protein [Acuticoccus sp. MNP-M23]|uniref:thioesterase family protein n=1 Tax=Acuticoccus sp. MNP-M23 TaxID=3072793 RepID=UPI002814E3DE|nr:thioesterase family protein [Acuticoccus sp. MNP-M23]WMS41170.1 thioesterase family protein [Acuticoccus sp. MNP-M23]